MQARTRICGPPHFDPTGRALASGHPNSEGKARVSPVPRSRALAASALRHISTRRRDRDQARCIHRSTRDAARSRRFRERDIGFHGIEVCRRRSNRAGLFDYDRSAPLGVVSGKTTTSQGIVREELSYLAGASLRLKAYFVHPASGGPWPLVIWSPGAGGDRNEQLPAGGRSRAERWRIAARRRPAHQTPCRNDLPLYVNYVVSRRRAVDLAATLPNVDAKRIAAAGFSFGAEITATLSGVDHRIAAFSLSSGRGHNTGFVRIFCKSLGAAKLERATSRSSASSTPCGGLVERPAAPCSFRTVRVTS